MKSLINLAIAKSSSIFTLGEARLTILIFHRVMESYDFMRPGETTANEFENKMRLISHACTPLSLSEAVERLENKTLPQRSICITFDDGYRDNAEVAYPILKKWSIPATFFVASSFLDGGRMWNDSVIETIRGYPKKQMDLTEIGLSMYDCSDERCKEQSAQKIIQAIKHNPQNERDEKVKYISSLVTALPDNLMMTSAQVKEMSVNGIEIGGHTVTHPILSTLTKERAEQEILGGKEALEKIIEKPVTVFAYPNGKPNKDFLPEHVEMVKKLGFKAAVSTNWGVSNANSDLYQMNRFTPWDKAEPAYLLRLIKNSINL